MTFEEEYEERGQAWDRDIIKTNQKIKKFENHIAILEKSLQLFYEGEEDNVACVPICEKCENNPKCEWADNFPYCFMEKDCTKGEIEK